LRARINDVGKSLCPEGIRPALGNCEERKRGQNGVTLQKETEVYVKLQSGSIQFYDG